MGSCGLPIAIVQHPAEARATGDLAICPVVIRRTDVPDELASNALVEPLGHVVLAEFLDQVAQMSLAENDELIETLVLGIARVCPSHVEILEDGFQPE
jgi:hypothetical protein